MNSHARFAILLALISAALLGGNAIAAGNQAKFDGKIIPSREPAST